MGHALGKVGSNGRGKTIQRFFRIAVERGRAYVVWSKTQGDLASFRAIMTGGLTDATAETDESDTLRFVVHTTAKSLHLVAPDAEHRTGWLRALRYLATGE
mmetsp:Transcript_18431/g.54602  ORF Transcript_18431/g.54602 Transcript_18431/m.54602 type:complete len:101 (-) Transcript_18431:1507-1809(-)